MWDMGTPNEMASYGEGYDYGKEFAIQQVREKLREAFKPGDFVSLKSVFTILEGISPEKEEQQD